MQFPIPAQNILTIPTGATSGTRIVLDGVRGAIFVYDASNNLIASISPKAGTDSFGNSYPSGYADFNPSFATGVRIDGATVSLTAFPFTTFGQLIGNIDNTLNAPFTELASPEITGSNGRGGLWVYGGDGSGVNNPFTLINYVLKVVQPGTAQTPETWHTIPLDAGWTTLAGHPVPSYRLLPDGNVQAVGFAQHASFSGVVALNSANPVSSNYIPKTLQKIDANDQGTGATVINTSGVFETSGFPTGSTQVTFGGIYPLDL